MTNYEKVKHILRRFPNTKFNRVEFFLRYLEIYCKAAPPNITYPQFRMFWRDFAGLERSLRDVLKESEFQLKPEQNAKRYEKMSLFKKNYAKKKEKTT